MKVLEPINSRFTSKITIVNDSSNLNSYNSNKSAQAAFEVFRLKWENNLSENLTRSYCTARQELNMLLSIKHPHITSFIGVLVFPMTLIFELAPHGALNLIIAKYKKYNTCLHMNTLQQTCVQVQLN